MKRTNIVCGFLGGLALCVIFVFTGYVPLLPDLEKTNIPIIEICVLLAGLITAFSISYKYCSIKQSLLRTALMFSSFAFTFIIIVQIGVLKYLDKLLQIGQRDSENMAPGISMAVVFCVSLQAAIATNVFLPIGKAIKAMLFKKQKG